MAQSIEVACPKCGQMLSIDAEYAGRKGKCPYCDEHFVIPDVEVELKPANGDVGTASSATQAPRDFVYFMSNPDEYRNFAWRRWSARWIDFWVGYGIVMVLFYGLAYLSGATGVGLGFWKWIAEPDHQIFDLILTTGLAFFSDALVYSIFRTTLGKMMNGISVCDISGDRIDWKGFLRRDVDVLLRGEWLCIPLLNAIAGILQYNRVSKGEPTSYDSGCVYQSRPTRGKAAYDIIIVIAVFVIGGAIRAATK